MRWLAAGYEAVDGCGQELDTQGCALKYYGVRVPVEQRLAD
jgi:hypothetical protein